MGISTYLYNAPYRIYCHVHAYIQREAGSAQAELDGSGARQRLMESQLASLTSPGAAGGPELASMRQQLFAAEQRAAGLDRELEAVALDRDSLQKECEEYKHRCDELQEELRESLRRSAARTSVESRSSPAEGGGGMRAVSPVLAESDMNLDSDAAHERMGVRKSAADRARGLRELEVAHRSLDHVRQQSAALQARIDGLELLQADAASLAAAVTDTAQSALESVRAAWGDKAWVEIAEEVPEAGREAAGADHSPEAQLDVLNWCIRSYNELCSRLRGELTESSERQTTLQAQAEAHDSEILSLKRALRESGGESEELAAAEARAHAANQQVRCV